MADDNSGYGLVMPFVGCASQGGPFDDQSFTAGLPEEWRTVPDWEGLYEVSNLGRVRSLDRVIQQRNGVKVRKSGRVLRPSPAATRNGKPVYETVVLCPASGEERARRTMYVHLLALAAFGSPRPSSDHLVRHLSGDHSDNSIGNLSWGTYSENNYDIVRHGRSAQARRARCPLDHELREPNLVACQQARGHRSCLACSRARAARQVAVKAGRVFVFRDSADLYYATIMQKAS